MFQHTFKKHTHLLIILQLIYVIQPILANKSEANNDKYPIITIEDGQIRGRTATTVGNNKTYHAFQGIPFAKPPLGELRFLPPLKNSKWNNVLDATKDKSECVQGLNPPSGSEDCLYINVYTTTLKRKSLPVMVWIYGGGFLMGNSSYSIYGPDYLLEEDVVFVSFNYRLGIFGFISTEDLECPGNVGLKDQVFALQWVQNNIKYFGGDPNKVTIFGQSAGSSSVSYLLQIKQTEGLFRSAILESGTSLCPWALTRKPRETSFSIGRSLKVNFTNSKTLLQGLREINYTVLQDISMRDSVAIFLKNPLAGLPFGPVKEPLHPEAVFHDNSDELLSKGEFHRVPTLIGITSNEVATVTILPAPIRVYIKTLDKNPTKLVPVDFTKDNLKLLSATGEIKLFYFGILPIAVQTGSFIKFLSDSMFNRGVRRTVIQQSKYSSVYFYKFSFGKGLVNSTIKGIGHGGELPYIFRNEGADTHNNFTENDFQMRSIMVKLWTNFAKFGNPTPEPQPLLQNLTWLKANLIKGNLIYLDINTDLEIQLNPFNREMKFWDGIYRRYGDPPYDTYR